MMLATVTLIDADLHAVPVPARTRERLRLAVDSGNQSKGEANYPCRSFVSLPDPCDPFGMFDNCAFHRRCRVRPGLSKHKPSKTEEDEKRTSGF
jgi:hypothetical protein